MASKLNNKGGTMYYLITKSIRYRHTNIEVLEFENEKEAIAEARKRPKNTVAIFEGRRLVAKKDKVRVVKEEVVGFEEYQYE